MDKDFVRPSKKLDLSGVFSIINDESTFNFVRKKNRHTTDNFDYIQDFHNEGKHFKQTIKVTEDVLGSVRALYLTFPNFHDVIEHIEKQLILKSIGNRQVKFEPIYLWGEPGIGKTEFALSLSKALEAPLEKVNASILTGSFSLAGSESQWADSAPGIVAKAMLKNKFANFIFFLDELEKVHTTGNGGNPLNALFDLLEESSAKRFVDMAFGDTVLFDATAINFIASGNDKTGIHPAILSRFNVFEVPVPSIEQLKSIVQNIHHSLLEKNDWGHYFSPNLSEEVIDAIIDDEQSIRHVKKNLKNAYINAYRSNRNYVTIDDMEFNNVKTFRMGFT
jgi:ATP-dependent Lon protease